MSEMAKDLRTRATGDKAVTAAELYEFIKKVLCLCYAVLCGGKGEQPQASAASSRWEAGWMMAHAACASCCMCLMLHVPHAACASCCMCLMLHVPLPATARPNQPGQSATQL